MKCSQCGKEFQAKRADARFCSGKCRIERLRSVTDNLVTDNSVTDNGKIVTDKKVLNLSDLGVDLKELGVQSCGPGLPILLVDMPTNDQIQSLCKVIHALRAIWSGNRDAVWGIVFNVCLLWRESFGGV